MRPHMAFSCFNKTPRNTDAGTFTVFSSHGVTAHNFFILHIAAPDHDDSERLSDENTCGIQNKGFVLLRICVYQNSKSPYAITTKTEKR